MCLSSPFVEYWCVLVQTVLGVNLHPLGGEDDAPLLWTESCVSWYDIGWYSFHRQSCMIYSRGKRGINPFQPWVRCKSKLGPIIYYYGFSLIALFSNSAHFKYHSAKYWGQLILGFNIKYSWVYEIYCIWVIPPRGGISLCQYTFCTTELYCVLCTMCYVLCTMYHIRFTYVFSNIESTICN